MTELDIALPPAPNFPHIERSVDEACIAAGLTLHSKSTLKQYRGCVHWHIRKGKQNGTLEITLWPQAKRLWFVVHDNRRAAWIDEAVAQLKPEIEGRVGQ